MFICEAFNRSKTCNFISRMLLTLTIFTGIAIPLNRELYYQTKQCHDEIINHEIRAYPVNYTNGIMIYKLDENLTCGILVGDNIQFNPNISLIIYKSNIDHCALEKERNRCAVPLFLLNLPLLGISIFVSDGIFNQIKKLKCCKDGNQQYGIVSEQHNEIEVASILHD